MLTDEEWAIISPLLSIGMQEIKQYRIEQGTSLEVATKVGFGTKALEAYQQMTGFKETNANALFHHRIKDHGPDCTTCGKPLRTPRATWCAACGADRSTPTN